MKDMVGVPGLVALLAISLGVQLLGFWGVIFGVPFAGAVYALLFDFYLPRRQGLPRPVMSEQPAAAQPAAKSTEREDAAVPALKRSSS
jgi:predicted PurR-regulated permease PerM